MFERKHENLIIGIVEKEKSFIYLVYDNNFNMINDIRVIFN